MTGYVPLLRVDLDRAETVFEPPESGEGNWVGAPCLHRHDGTTYLAARWRSPERRGYAVGVYERTGPASFAERTRLTAADLGVVSVERPALLTDPRSGDLKLYLPVEHGENDWTIRKLDDAADPVDFDPDTARDVLVPTPGTTDEETVKDPIVLTLGGRYYMYYAGHDGVAERAHLATSVDGESWTPAGTNPVLGRGGWHDHHTRVSCVVPAPDAPTWLVLYDGSGTDDHGRTWNLRTGVAVAPDPTRVVDTTPDVPALSAPVADRETGLEAFGTCRYADLLEDDGDWELFVEVARADGAFELRRSPVHWA